METFELIKKYTQSLISVMNLRSMILILIPILTIIYFSFSLPISYDEAWTYINFTNKGILYSITRYPLPNNHIFHSVVTNIFHLFFPFYPKLNLRLPVIIVSFISMLVSLHFFKKFYNEKIALLVTGIFTMLPMSIYYEFMSRGYAYVMLFFILSINYSYNIIKNGNKNKDWIAFSIFSVLGFYTMPSYLYIFLIINSIILINCTKSIFIKQCKSISLIGLLVILIYFPVIYISGLNSLINNKFVKPIDRSTVLSHLPYFIKYSLEDILGYKLSVLFFFLLFPIFSFIRNKDFFHFKILLIFLVLPSCLLLIHSVIPPSRTFNYYAFIFTMFFFISINKYLNSIKVKHIVAIVLLIQITSLYNFNSKIFKIEEYAIETKNIITKIESENKIYSINSDLFKAYLSYYFNQDKIKVYKINKYNLSPINIDTIHHSDFIIIDKIYDKTKNKKPIIVTSYYNIYNN